MSAEVWYAAQGFPPLQRCVVSQGQGNPYFGSPMSVSEVETKGPGKR